MLQLIYFILVTQDVHFRTATKEAHVACPIHNLCPCYYELYLQKPIGQKKRFLGHGEEDDWYLDTIFSLPLYKVLLPMV